MPAEQALASLGASRTRSSVLRDEPSRNLAVPASENRRPPRRTPREYPWRCRGRPRSPARPSAHAPKGRRPPPLPSTAVTRSDPGRGAGGEFRLRATAGIPGPARRGRQGGGPPGRATRPRPRRTRRAPAKNGERPRVARSCEYASSSQELHQVGPGLGATPLPRPLMIPRRIQARRHASPWSKDRARRVVLNLVDELGGQGSSSSMALVQLPHRSTSAGYTPSLRAVEQGEGGPRALGSEAGSPNRTLGEEAQQIRPRGTPRRDAGRPRRRSPRGRATSSVRLSRPVRTGSVRQAGELVVAFPLAPIRVISGGVEQSASGDDGR